MQASDTDPLTQPRPLPLRPFPTAWGVLGLPVLLVLVGARSLRFWIDAGPALRELLRPALDAATNAFLTSFTAFQLNGVVIGAMLLPLLVWWPWFARRVDGELRMSGWVHFWAWVALLLNQHFFDINRFLAPWCAFGLLVLWGLLRAARSPGLAAHGRTLVRAGWLGTSALGAWLAPCLADAVGVGIFAAGTYWLHVPLRGRLGWLERMGLTLVAVPLVQLLVVSRDVSMLLLLPAVLVASGLGVRRLWPRSRALALAAGVVLPAVLGGGGAAILQAAFDHGGRHIGSGLAYSFCEMPDGSRVVAAVPMCPIGGKNCQDGHLLVYDPDDDWRAERIDAFPEPGRFGRLEQVVCMPEELQIGMCCVTDGDHPREEDTLSVPLNGEGGIRFGYAGQPLTRRLVWDAARDRIYYVGEYVRSLDLRTGHLSDALQQKLESLAPAAELRGAIFTAEWESLHPGRDSVYISEFARGSRIYAANRSTGEVSLLTDLNNGGVLGVTVDEPLDRLYVNGLYGIDVFDFATGRVLATLRTGTLARVPVVDERRDLIYVPCTVGGRIEVFHRRSFEHLGAIPIGIETRNALLTASGRWLVASEARDQVAWPAEDLARRFGWEPEAAEPRAGEPAGMPR